MANRRETLKIIGAVSATCAFPFSADELYGQHVHEAAKPPAAAPYDPQFFKKAEWQTLCALCDAIIPRTDTPGAVEAGVPEYVDRVVATNAEHRKRFREGLRRLNSESKRRYSMRFAALSEEQQVAVLTPHAAPAAWKRPLSRAGQFFRVAKNMIADGYYTSRIGLVDELGYQGNTVLEKFPDLEIPEH